MRGAHTLPGASYTDSRAPYLNNGNTIGLEIIARDDADGLPVQVKAAIELLNQLYTDDANVTGFNVVVDAGKQTWGHGEVTPGHKRPTTYS